MKFCPQTLTSSLIVVVAVQLQVEMADSLGASELATIMRLKTKEQKDISRWKRPIPQGQRKKLELCCDPEPKGVALGDLPVSL